MASPIKDNPFTADEHLRFFGEFCLGVQRAGGTTPHMLMAVKACEGLDVRDQLWRAGCYAFVYNIPTAEVLWRNWQPGEWKHDDLVKWIADNWKGIKFRKERKAARSPERLATCMKSYADYMQLVSEREWFLSDDIEPGKRYADGFEDICKSVKYMGRYIAIRWLEVMRRVYDLPIPMPDLRPRDGDHPRKALALMYPEYMEELMGGNDDQTIEIVNDVVEFCREDLLDVYDLDVDYYTMQSLLCEYKQSALGMRQYPGKSVDTTLKYFKEVYDYWGQEEAEKTEIWNIRASVFPEFVLGEKSGWDGVRAELGEVLRKYNYTWSDYLYDYAKTTDLANPVRRVH
jgi:hypothetical protein